MEQWLENNQLKGWSEEQLIEYRKHLEETIGNCTVFLTQVDEEIERRYYE